MITTITTTAQEDQRIAAAFGPKLNLGRNATATEVKQDIIGYIRNVVTVQENIQARSDALSAVALPTPIQPT